MNRPSPSPALSSSSAPAAKPELLAPAGGPDAFYAALAAGADAIYCGMGSFNARRKAANFTDEAFADACRAAHLAGARVYVTVNIVIKDEELPEALELVRRCACLGADAFIIQDWGLFFELRRLMPDIETHISTQANIHDTRGTAWCRDAGADRVTLSRELSIEEIAHIAREGIELEVFAHGSICFCYSGVCLLSSFTSGGRSANRGMCAQPCRLPYELVDERGRTYSGAGRERALCPRDTCTVDLLPRLLDAGAHALKLEGRMKAPDYVHSIVSAYRAQLDDILAGRETTPEDSAARYRQLKRCFNRDFTHEYQEGRSGDEMMSYERSNNRGQEVGTVLDSRPVGGTEGLRPDDRRRRAALARIRLSEPVGKGDLLELRHNDEFDQFLTTIAAEDAPAGAVITARVARAMPTGSRVRLIRSQAALDAANAALKRDVPRKRPVAVQVRARRGEPFAVTLTCCDNPALTATATGFTVEAARTKAVTAADLETHVGRMGSSPFEAASFAIELDDDCGMGFAAVHKVRAAACAALEARIHAPYEQRAEALRALPPFATSACTADTRPAGDSSAGAHGDGRSEACGGAGGIPGTAETARATASRADAAAPAPATAPAPTLAGNAHEATPKPASSVASACERTDDAHEAADAANASAQHTPGEVCALVTSLDAAASARDAGATRIYLPVDTLLDTNLTPCDAEARGFIPVLDEVSREADHDRLDPWVRSGAPVAVDTISELALAAQRGANAELRSCIPVHNLACLRALAARGAHGILLSPELTLAEIERIAPHAGAVALGLTVIGRPRVMTSEHCILQVADACIHDCERCALRRRSFSLKNIDGRLLPIRTDVHGRSHLYDAYPLDATPQLPRLLAAGVTRFLVDGTLCTPEETARLVAHAGRALDAARAGRRPAARMQGATSGCLFMGVS